MTIADDLKKDAHDLEVRKLETAQAVLKKQVTDLKRELTQSRTQQSELEKRIELLSSLDGVTVTAPKWMAKKGSKTQHVGIANLCLSDLHLDEVVQPAEIGGVNSFNRKIAELRLEKTFDRFVVVAKEYLKGLTYEGACIWLGGDIFSGNIHEELKNTNEAPLLATFDYWIDPMVAGIKMVADEFGKVHLPGVVGNHGRNTRKPIAKSRVEDNFDWLFYRQLARALKDDSRISFQFPLSADCIVSQYDTKFLFTHGDQFRGGSGISGLLAPLMTGDFRKRKRQNAVDDPYDVMVMGHWHQYGAFRGIIVNGSLKGYDEYAYVSNFDFEVPQQAFWVTTPEHGVTFSAPIRPMDRKKEGNW